MEQTRNSYQIWWVYDQPITAVVTVVMPIGCTFLTGFTPAGAGVGLVRDLSYLTFTLRGTYTTATLMLRCEIATATGTFDTWWTHNHSGSGNNDTVHNMAAPYGNPMGIMGLATQYLRFSVDAGGAGNVSGFYFSARAWKE